MLPAAETICAPQPFADPMLPEPWTITRRRRETADSFRIEVAPPATHAAAYEFRAGQFNMLYVFGVGEVPISVSGSPLEPLPLMHTIRAVGTVTRAMAAMKRGASVGVREPFGTSWPLDLARGRDVVIVAGGIGLAPLRPVIAHILARRREFGRVALVCGTRTPDDLLFSREVARWATREDLQVLQTVDRAPRGWSGNIGVVTTQLPRAGFDPATAIAMLCGPEIMMRFAARDLEHRGVSSDRIFVSMERNMKCAIGFCGHCQYGPAFVCKDGPVFRYDRVKPLLNIREL
jgi:NAD(P)H-flavin reductase